MSLDIAGSVAYIRADASPNEVLRCSVHTTEDLNVKRSRNRNSEDRQVFTMRTRGVIQAPACEEDYHHSCPRRSSTTFAVWAATA